MSAPSSRPRLQLLTLAGLHGYADLVGSLLPGFLPALLPRFNISLGAAALLICCVGIGSNLLQVPLAAATRSRRSPGWLLFGMGACSLVMLFSFLPGTTPLWALCLLLVVIGAGIALIHPLALRGVAGLDGIHPLTATPIFMIGGFTGFAAAPFVGAVLVERFGFPGLLWLLLPAGALAAAVAAAGLKLADGKGEGGRATIPDPRHWSFRRLMVLSFFLNSGTLTVQSLLPTRLVDLGHSLAFGGFRSMLFGLGSAAGSLLAGHLAKRFGSGTLVIAGLAIGTPLTLACLCTPGAAFLPPFLVLAGMTAAASFPLIVAMAGSLPGNGDLGTRLAWLVGGTWGAAGLAFLLVGQLADAFGSGVILLSAAFYAAALASALFPGRR